MGLSAGKLRNRITLLSATAGTSLTGANSAPKYVEGATIWANVEPLSVRDAITAQAAGSKTRLRCVIRYRPGIVSSMRVRFNDQDYEIDGDPLADRFSGREYLTLMLASI